MQEPEQKKKALIVVRTYPTPAKSGVEVSCTAAITDDGKWLRLYPIPYRLLPRDQRFRKYQWVEVTVTKASKDSRPESHKVKPDSISILSEPLPSDSNWSARKTVVFPLKSHCLCCLEQVRGSQSYPTLGFFRPHKIEGLIIGPDSATWTASQAALLRQGHLFEPNNREELEKIPHKFQYKFSCDHASCHGHTLMCTDWEMSESWREWRTRYGLQWETKFRERFEKDMIERFDTHFFVGTLHQHPNRWIVVGLFYPPKSTRGDTLFDLYGEPVPAQPPL